jgi:rhodanese-related sulfurtransferase
MSEEQFVRIVLADQPDTPAYFTYDAVLNTREHPTLDQALESELRPLSLADLLTLRDGGAQILDGRDGADFAAAHLIGSLNVGLSGSFATWCGTLLDRDRPMVLVTEPGREGEAATRLGRIGFDGVAGYLDGGMQALAPRPDLVEQTECVTAGELSRELDGSEPPLVLDVRTEREWLEHHIPSSLNLPLSRLDERSAELSPQRRIVVHCASGYRSGIAASQLRRRGLVQVADLVGGLGAWEASRLPTAGGAPEQSA